MTMYILTAVCNSTTCVPSYCTGILNDVLCNGTLPKINCTQNALDTYSSPVFNRISGVQRKGKCVIMFHLFSFNANTSAINESKNTSFEGGYLCDERPPPLSLREVGTVAKAHVASKLSCRPVSSTYRRFCQFLDLATPSLIRAGEAS